MTYTLKQMGVYVLAMLTALTFMLVAWVQPADAARTESNTAIGSNLGDLIILSELFDDEGDLFGGEDGTLTDLIVLDALFADSNGTFSRTGNSGIFGSSNLGDLVVLDALFNDDSEENGDGMFSGDSSLKDLVVLDRVFDGRQVVVVESGDTLSGIARDFLGDASRYPEIAKLNNIADPNVINPGQRLTLPRNGGIVGGNNGLTDLVVLKSLFNDDDDLFGGDSTLEDLILLDAVFGTGNGGGIFGR